jgi:hypothetical protein
MASLKKHKETNPQHIKAILKSFYGSSYASSIEVNDQVVDVVWKMVSSSKECTKLLNLVPRPAGFIPGPSYIATQLASLVKRLSTNKKENVAHMCKAVASNGYSTKIRLSALGL